jgi:hypothetical protein
LVLPQPYFDEKFMKSRNPVRFSSLRNNRYYINRVIDDARAQCVDVFFETKEVWFHDLLLELHPEVRGPEGALCATHPFWWEFVEAKMRDAIELVPGFAGIIVSPGTRESMVSISTNACRCERCRSYDPAEWYRRLFDGMHRPLAEHGKTLAVRDFSYTEDQQSHILSAATACSSDIVVSLKNTPHDFYPTFPNNPRIGRCGPLRQWIEFDTWGQFFGLGVFPVSVAEDMKERLRHCRERGATGAYFRTDWEVITDNSSFNSFNLLNLFAGAMLTENTETDLDDVYRAWIDHGLLSSLQTGSMLQEPERPAASDALERLKAFMQRSWSILEKGIYARGHVFHENSQFPDSVWKAFYIMFDFHKRDYWDPGSTNAVRATDENIAAVVREKEEALRLVQSLPDLLDVDRLGVSESLGRDLKDLLRLYEAYIAGFHACAEACFRGQKALESGTGEDASAARACLPALAASRDALNNLLGLRSYPHLVYELIDTSRLDGIMAAIESACPAAATAS